MERKFQVDGNLAWSDPGPSTKGTFYAEIALVWGLILSVFLMWYANRLDYDPTEISLAIVIVLIGALLTRMAAFQWRVKSPMY